MALGCEGDDQNDTVSSLSLTEETTATKRQRLTTSIGTLTSPAHSLSSSSELPGDSLHAPPLPFDLAEKILCRLPVKFLLQLRCVCKSWKSLIDDPTFAKKHLQVSTTRHQHRLISSSMSASRELLLWDSPIPSIFKAVSTSSVTQMPLRYPTTLNNRYRTGLSICTCDGILCLGIDHEFAFLWNPSIRKSKILPPLENPRPRGPHTLYSFGYDHFIHNYKIVAVSFCKKNDVSVDEVSVHTLGTDSWRRIQDFPYCGSIRAKPGVFVSGTVNWLAFDALSSSRVIVSLDLEKESYQKLLLQPDYGMVDNATMTLRVLRDCLCIFLNSDKFVDVWVMKEYGNKESWTKLFTIPSTRDVSFKPYTKVVMVYIYEDDQVLLNFKELSQLKLVVYDSRNGTFEIPKIQNINSWIGPEVYVESLISPCS